MKKLTTFCLSAMIITVAAVCTSCKTNEPTDEIIDPNAEYELYVAGTQVTGKNALDIKNELIHGKVSYNPKTKTLTMDNAAVITERSIHGIKSEIDGLTINLIGQNKIMTDAVAYYPLILKENTTITGSSSTKLALKAIATGGAGIVLYNSVLSITGGCEVVAEGEVGVSSVTNTTGTLKVYGSTLKAKGAVLYSIGYLDDLILTACNITKPVGAQWDKDKKFVMNNGVSVKDWVEITPINK